MAINFLNTVDLNYNQLNKAAIQNLAADPAIGVVGQLYYNTAASTLKVCVTANTTAPVAAAVWASVSGDITAVIPSVDIKELGIKIADQGGPIPKVGLDIIGQTDLATVASDDELIIYDLSSPTNKSITVENLVGGYETTYTLPVTAGVVSPSAPTTGIITLTGADGAGGSTTDVVTFVGTTGRVDVAGNAAGSTITVDLTDSVTVVDNINLGGVITQAGGVSTTGVNASALTGATTLILTADNAAVIVGMQLSGAGITGNITVTSVTNAKTFVLSGAITIADAITITFEEVNNFSSPLSMNNNRIHEVKTGVLGTDGVNLGQVQDLVAGIGLFKGGYNADTGLTVNLGAGNGSLDGGSNIALDTGDFFVVTTDGSAFYTTALEVGDMIFANTTIAASSTPPESSYTVVIQDANIAGADSTDAATEKGVAGFDSANFNVSATGWVQLAPQRNPYGRKQSLNNTSPSSSSGLVGGVTTFTVLLDDASLFGSGTDAENVMVEVTTQASEGPYQTVYADVTRSGSASIAIAFVGAVVVPNDAYQVLLTHI